jgi:hypothetical protein
MALAFRIGITRAFWKSLLPLDVDDAFEREPFTSVSVRLPVGLALVEVVVEVLAAAVVVVAVVVVVVVVVVLVDVDSVVSGITVVSSALYFEL